MWVSEHWGFMREGQRVSGRHDEAVKGGGKLPLGA